jgi:hypothetical protein
MTLLTIYFSSDHVWTRLRFFKTTYPVLSFVRAGGGRRLGGDPHVAPALAALSLGYAGGLLQCGVCGAGPISTPMPPYDS